MATTRTTPHVPGAGAQPAVTDPAGQATADAAAAGASTQRTEPLQGAQVAALPTDPLLVKGGKVRPGSTADKTEYAELVRARGKGEYNGLKAKGDVFANDRNLPTFPEDPESWIEDADRDSEWEAKEKAEKRRNR